MSKELISRSRAFGALVDLLRAGRANLVDPYSDVCLRRVWRAEHFSWWLTTTLHRPENGDPFEFRLQESQLRYLTTSESAARTLAESAV